MGGGFFLRVIEYEVNQRVKALSICGIIKKVLNT